MSFDPVLVIAVLGLVNFIKSFGMEGKIVTLISMLIGVTFYILQQVLDAEIFRVVLGGVVLGLGASGFYDLSQTLGALRKSA